MPSKDNVKNQIRTKTQPSAAHAMNNFNNEENNVDTKEEKKVERIRVSFDLREDLHTELKMKSVSSKKKMYLMIEEAIADYLDK